MSAEVVPPSVPAAVAVVVVVAELVRLMQLRVVIQKDQRVASLTLLEKLRRPFGGRPLIIVVLEYEYLLFKQNKRDQD